jgi:hypothetical protein
MTGNYDLSFYVMGACIALSGAIGFPLKAINRWEKRRATQSFYNDAPANDVEKVGNGKTPHKSDEDTSCEMQLLNSRLRTINESDS